jgi:hypothetical protein
MRKINYLLFLFLLSGCARFYNNEQFLRNLNNNSGFDFVETCSLDGAWVRCSATGLNSSVKTLISFSGSSMTETNFVFNSNSVCGGDEDSSNKFDAEIVVNGNNLDIIPSTDVFSCGPQQPAFTIFRLGDDCETLQIASSAPSCSVGGRPTNLDLQKFNRL